MPTDHARRDEHTYAGYDPGTTERIVTAQWRFSGLLVSSCLLWAGGTFYLVNTGPYLMSASTPAERNYAFSVFSAVIAIIGFAGNLIGGFLPALSPPRWVSLQWIWRPTATFSGWRLFCLVAVETSNLLR